MEGHFGYKGSRSPVHRGRATTHRAKPQDSATGGPAAHIKELGRQEARANAFLRRREYDEQLPPAAALETQKNRSKTKANHGFDHVDDRPRARADGGA